MVRDLISYLSGKCSTVPSLSHMSRILSPDSPTEVGLILTERLVNVPAEVVPPMYCMLLEEMQWALEEKEPYKFSEYIVLSKTYREVESSADQEQDRPQKKSRKSRTANNGLETFYFHPEDEVLQKHAAEFGSFGYSRQDADGNPDSKRAFQELGIRPQGHIMLIEAGRFEPAVKAMAETFRPG